MNGSGLGSIFDLFNNTPTARVQRITIEPLYGYSSSVESVANRQILRNSAMNPIRRDNEEKKGRLYDILANRNIITDNIPSNRNNSRVIYHRIGSAAQSRSTHEENIDYLRDYNNKIEHTEILPRNIMDYYNNDNYDVFTFSGPISNFMNMFEQIFNRFDDVKTPMTSAAYESLYVDEFKNIKKESEIDTCPICLEKFIDTDKLKILPCKHFFHIKCIEPWLLSQSHTCPLCRIDCGEHRANI
jgi:hypothetical protein